MFDHADPYRGLPPERAVADAAARLFAVARRLREASTGPLAHDACLEQSRAIESVADALATRFGAAADAYFRLQDY